MSHNKLIKNYIYNTAYQLLVLIAPLITTPYVSRVLGATGIGIYSYAQSIATYFVLVGAIGTTLYGQREIAFVQTDPVKRTAVFWEITVIRIVAVCVCTVIYCLTFASHGQYAEVYRILTLEVIATALDVSWFFMGMENFKLTVIRNTIIKLVGIILVFLLVKTPDDVNRYTLCLTLPVFLGNVSLWPSLRKYLVKQTSPLLPGIPRHIQPVLLLFLPQIATEVYTVLDKTMIGAICADIAQVGFYTQAQKIVKIVLTIITSLGTVMLPAMSAAFANNQKDKIVDSISVAFRFIFLLSSAMLFGLLAVSRRFVPIFFGKGYDLVVPLMAVISPILVIIGISNVIGKQYLLPTLQQKAYTISIVSGAGMNLILNGLLIRPFGAIGASIATVFAELAVALVQIWFVRGQLPLKTCLKPLPKYLVFGLVMFAAVKFVDYSLPQGILGLAAMILVGIIVYAAELLITRDPLLKMGKQMLKRRKAGRNNV